MENNSIAIEQRAKITGRLKRVERQIRGICKMIDEGRDCLSIMGQLTSVSGAMNGIRVSVAAELINNDLKEVPLVNYSETANALLEHLRSL